MFAKFRAPNEDKETSGYTCFSGLRTGGWRVRIKTLSIDKEGTPTSLSPPDACCPFPRRENRLAAASNRP